MRQSTGGPERALGLLTSTWNDRWMGSEEAVACLEPGEQA